MAGKGSGGFCRENAAKTPPDPFSHAPIFRRAAELSAGTLVTPDVISPQFPRISCDRPHIAEWKGNCHSSRHDETHAPHVGRDDRDHRGPRFCEVPADSNGDRARRVVPAATGSRDHDRRAAGRMARDAQRHRIGGRRARRDRQRRSCQAPSIASRSILGALCGRATCSSSSTRARNGRSSQRPKRSAILRARTSIACRAC